jgi:hypothetical protein
MTILDSFRPGRAYANSQQIRSTLECSVQGEPKQTIGDIQQQIRSTRESAEVVSRQGAGKFAQDSGNRLKQPFRQITMAFSLAGS